MARKLRIEVEGELFTLSRAAMIGGIFHSHEDHLKFLSPLANQKKYRRFTFMRTAR